MSIQKNIKNLEREVKLLHLISFIFNFEMEKLLF